MSNNWDIIYALKYSFANEKLRVDFEQEQEDAYHIKRLIAGHLSAKSSLSNDFTVKVTNGGRYKRPPQLDALLFDNNKIKPSLSLLHL